MDFSDLLFNSAWSLLHVGIGSGLGVALGTAVGTLRYLLARRFPERWPVTVLFEFMRFPPPIAWLPFVILFFGVGFSATAAVVCLAVFPAVATNLYEGLGQIPLPIRRFAASLELSPLHLLKSVYLPAIRAQLFTGMRIGIGIGWMSVIAAEMVGGQNGLGYAIQLNRVYSQYAEMILGIAAIGLIGFLLHLLLSRWERRYSVSGERKGA